jgi:hypothetical protein
MFGLFNKKEKFDWDAWDKQYPIGKKVKYLGITMIVIKNFEVILGHTPTPALFCEYVNNLGEIKSCYFNKNQIQVLEEV